MTTSRLDAAATEGERCRCGNLLAKVSPRGIEIMCRRCKRVHSIPWPEPGKKGRREGKDVALLTR